MSHISNLSAEFSGLSINRVRQREDEPGATATHKRLRTDLQMSDLFSAISERNAKLVENILLAQPELVDSNDGTCTPLVWFVIKRTLKRSENGYKKNDSFKIGQALLNAKADVNGVAPYLEMSPLLWAASLGKAATVSYLLEHGADVNGQNSDGDTALMLSGKAYINIEIDEDEPQTEKHKKEIPQLLLDANADTDILNNKDLTVLDQAVRESIHPEDKQWRDNLFNCLMNQTVIL